MNIRVLKCLVCDALFKLNMSLNICLTITILISKEPNNFTNLTETAVYSEV